MFIDYISNGKLEFHLQSLTFGVGTLHATLHPVSNLSKTCRPLLNLLLLNPLIKLPRRALVFQSGELLSSRPHLSRLSPNKLTLLCSRTIDGEINVESELGIGLAQSDKNEAN